MRVVIDTNVFVSGLLLPESTPGRIMQAWRDGQFEVVMSDPMLDEIERVLQYPKIQSRLGWTDDVISRYVELLRFRTDVVSVDPSTEASTIATNQPVRDPGDLIVLQTFIAGSADVVVSGDKDLLALDDEFPVERPSEFSQRL